MSVALEEPIVATTEEPLVVRTSWGLTIAGTRITLYALMDYVTAGWPREEIREIYPQITDQQFNAAMDYIEVHRVEVEAEYKIVVQEAEEDRRYWEERNKDRVIPPPVESMTPEQKLIWEKLQAFKQRHGLQ